MNIKKLIYASIVLILISTFYSFGLDKEADKRTHVIIISVDTLRADHLGCYGYPLNTSPSIDSLAADGVLFANCYSLTPYTVPSFSTMMTSLPPHKHGAKRNGLGIYKNIVTLPLLFKDEGYNTAGIISNWPLRKKLSNLDTGFNWYKNVFTRKRYLGLTRSEGTAPIVARKAINWLRKNVSKDSMPVFLWVQFTDPHAPYKMHQAHRFDYSNVQSSVYPKGTRLKKVKRYDSEIAFTDFYIGNLLAELKRLGIYDNSLILFNSDHGESFGEHNYFNHGKNLYNSTLHVPLIIKLPENRLKNTRRFEDVSILDIATTVLEVLDMPKVKAMQGLNIFDDQELISSRTLTFETYGGSVIFKRNNKKYHLSVKPVKYGILKQSIKLIFNPKKSSLELYRINSDPFELNNIRRSRPLQTNLLKRELFSKISVIKKRILAAQSTNKQRTDISEVDLKQLKTLGYIDD
jgi:arylsulfatase A-like enzyme